MALSMLAQAFIEGIGKPDPATPNGLRFKSPVYDELWLDTHAEIGSGWYLNRFLYLFGEGVEKLQPCLDAWSFVVPPNHPDRIILGRNAYGAILVLENGNSADASVLMLDPLLVDYWSDPRIGFENMLGRWLPQKEIPHFLDKDLYDAWVIGHGRHLGDDTILAAKTPLSLGGEMEPENFQEEPIIDYYRTTAPIYEKALEKIKKGRKPSKRPGRRK
jgi:hypothetical protein